MFAKKQEFTSCIAEFWQMNLAIRSQAVPIGFELGPA
jgi:hypothetical protein